nr:MAG TPA: hypothetical protein [Caudoviricetes sp.]
MVSKYYRNRISMDTLLTAPLGFLHYLYFTAVQESQSDAGKAQQQRYALEDALEGGAPNDVRRVSRNFVLKPKPNQSPRPM